MFFIDRAGKKQSDHEFGDLGRLTESGWVIVIPHNDPWRVSVKLNGKLVTRAALDATIAYLESTSAGDIRIEDMTTRIPQTFSGWTRTGGLNVLKSLLFKIRVFRALGDDPEPLKRGMDVIPDGEPA